MNFIEKIIKYSPIILLVIAILFGIHKFQQWHTITGIITNNGSTEIHVSDAKIEKPSKTVEDAVRIKVGKDAAIVGSIKLTPTVGEDKSKVSTTSVVLVNDCVTCTVRAVIVEEKKNYLGFSFRPKFYIGYIDDSISIGYAQEVFRYSKYSLNGTLTVPYVGLGFSYDVTNNFYFMGSANSRYIGYNSVKDIGSYHLDLDAIKQPYPMLSIGFYF